MSTIGEAIREVRWINEGLTAKIVAKPTPDIPDDLEDLLIPDPIFGKALMIPNTELFYQLRFRVNEAVFRGKSIFYALRQLRDHPLDYITLDDYELLRCGCPELFRPPMRQLIREGMEALA